MNYFKSIFGILFIFINWACIQSPPKIHEDIKSNQKNLNKSIDSQMVNNSFRTIKLYFWYTQEAPFDSYTGYIVRIGSNEFTLSQDTLTLILPQQNMDTIFTRLPSEKQFKVHSLLKFKNNLTYKLRVNSCSDIEYLEPQDGNKRREYPQVSFTIKNYKKQDRILGIPGFKYETDEDLILKNNFKTPYEILASSSAMCGTDPSRVAIEYKNKKVITEFWYQDMHGDTLDVIYDFKTKKTEVFVKD